MANKRRAGEVPGHAKREVCEAICPKCGNWVDMFQPDLFELERGRYLCVCGYRSAKVYQNYERLAGIVVTPTSREENDAEHSIPKMFDEWEVVDV